jgi:mercuric ion transport protein
MLTLWHTIKGYFMAVTAFIACPCHLPLTLPLLLGLTAGTALGTWLNQNVTLVYVLSTATFLGGLALALKWLGMSDGRRAAPVTGRRNGRMRITPLQPSTCADCEPAQAPGRELQFDPAQISSDALAQIIASESGLTVTEVKQ